MPVLSVGKDRLHFLDEGIGEPIVFVHGSCGGGRQWKGLSSALAKHYRTLCLDLFGSGQSEPWPFERKWSVEEDNRAINAILDHLGRPFHFVIHSGGAHSAYPAIKNRRDRIMSVTLFEPTYFHLLRQVDDPLFAEPEEMARVYRAAMENGDRAKATGEFVDKWAGAEGTWDGLPESVKEMMKRGANRLYYEWLVIRGEEPSCEDLRALDLPVLLFKGERTIPSMHRVCEILAEDLPDCHYVEIPGAGHMSPFTHYSDILSVVEQHLAGQGA